MEIVWIDSHCDAKPTAPHAHYWVAAQIVDSGNIFHCKFCGQFQWWPRSFDWAVRMKEYFARYGNDRGYNEFLEFFPVARKTLLRLQSMRHIRRLITDEQQLAAIILAISKEG